MRSLHVDTEKFFIQYIEYPNLDPGVRQWLTDNLRSKIIEFFKQHTITYKAKSAYKPPKPHNYYDQKTIDWLNKHQGVKQVAVDAEQPSTSSGLCK